MQLTIARTYMSCRVKQQPIELVVGDGISANSKHTGHDYGKVIDNLEHANRVESADCYGHSNLSNPDQEGRLRGW